MWEAVFDVLFEFWSTLAEMSPYLLFGFFVAGLLSIVISPGIVERHLGGRGLWPVVKASLFGVPLPLCSCGVIPVAASLRRHGASRGATTSFLLSTPQTGVDSVFVTFSLLGPVFAVFRPLAALATGVFGGALVAAAGEDGASVGECRGACCSTTAAGGSRIARMLRYGFITLPRDIGRPLFIGLAAAGILAVLVPKDFFVATLGAGIGTMLVMMLLGIPMYVCATASVPIAAALITKGGLSPGAALVFLMTGPATNVATIATVMKILGKRAAFMYLLTVAGAALGSGLLLDYIFDVGNVLPPSGTAMFLPAAVKAGSAVVLLAVLAFALLSGGRHERHVGDDAEGKGLSKTTLLVTGMTCSHCADAVTRALSEVAGVASVRVDRAAGRAVVSGARYDAGALVSAVEALGYRAEREDGS